MDNEKATFKLKVRHERRESFLSFNISFLPSPSRHRARSSDLFLQFGLCLVSKFTSSHGIVSVLEHQVSLVYENPLDGAFPKCIQPHIKILEGPAPSVVFSFGPFYRSLRQRSKGYRTGPFPYLKSHLLHCMLRLNSISGNQGVDSILIESDEERALTDSAQVLLPFANIFTPCPPTRIAHT